VVPQGPVARPSGKTYPRRLQFTCQCMWLQSRRTYVSVPLQQGPVPRPNLAETAARSRRQRHLDAQRILHSALQWASRHHDLSPAPKLTIFISRAPCTEDRG
jgi:hypothetical protein